MDYVAPPRIIAEAVQIASRKARLSIVDMVIRGMLAGAFLAYATSLAIIVTAQGIAPVVGAILFPAGFVMLVLLGLELATGNFALLPMGAVARKISGRAMLRNWLWVYAGNLAGSLLYAVLFYLAITNCGTSDGGAIAATVRQIAQKKTLAYMSVGASGWSAALIKGVLCNWMVTVGVMLALVSRSTIAKIAAMWLPIMTFFALGYEHSIVNMYVIPSGMLLGAPISLRAWWFWNQLPVTMGNLVGGSLFTGLAMYLTHAPRAAPLQKPEAVLEPVLAGDRIA